MATTYFADRGTLQINSIVVAHIKSLKVTIDDSVSRVDTMTSNRRSSGWKKGNRKVSGSFELEVPDQKAQIDLSFQYGNEITATASFGTSSERFTIIGMVQTTSDISGSVGDVTKSINFEAIDAVNENGVAVNAQIGF